MKCNSIDDSKGNIVDLEESHKYGIYGTALSVFYWS